MITVEVNQDDVRKLMWKLRKMQSKTPSRLKNAINRTGTQAMKMIRAGKKEGYTMRAGRFMRDIKTQRANLSHLDYTITASGRPATLLGNYKASVLKKAGGRADILNNGYGYLETGAGKSFVPAGGKASGLLISRRDKRPTKTISGVHKLENIHVLHGPSVPKMLEKIYEGKRGGQGNMQKKIQERLHREIQQEITRIVR